MCRDNRLLIWILGLSIMAGTVIISLRVQDLQQEVRLLHERVDIADCAAWTALSLAVTELSDPNRPVAGSGCEVVIPAEAPDPRWWTQL